MPDQPACANCQFYIPRPKTTDRGDCRRYPPQADYHWPRPQATDWCGEHQPANAAFRNNALP